MKTLATIRRVAAEYDQCFGRGSAAREFVFLAAIAPVLFGIIALAAAVVGGR